MPDQIRILTALIERFPEEHRETLLRNLKALLKRRRTLH